MDGTVVDEGEYADDSKPVSTYGNTQTQQFRASQMQRQSNMFQANPYQQGFPQEASRQSQAFANNNYMSQYQGYGIPNSSNSFTYAQQPNSLTATVIDEANYIDNNSIDPNPNQNAQAIQQYYIQPNSNNNAYADQSYGYQPVDQAYAGQVHATKPYEQSLASGYGTVHDEAHFVIRNAASRSNSNSLSYPLNAGGPMKPPTNSNHSSQKICNEKIVDVGELLKMLKSGFASDFQMKPAEVLNKRFPMRQNHAGYQIISAFSPQFQAYQGKRTPKMGKFAQKHQSVHGLLSMIGERASVYQKDQSRIRPISFSAIGSIPNNEQTDFHRLSNEQNNLKKFSPLNAANTGGSRKGENPQVAALKSRNARTTSKLRDEIQPEQEAGSKTLPRNPTLPLDSISTFDGTDGSPADALLREPAFTPPPPPPITNSRRSVSSSPSQLSKSSEIARDSPESPVPIESMLSSIKPPPTPQLNDALARKAIVRPSNMIVETSVLGFAAEKSMDTSRASSLSDLNAPSVNLASKPKSILPKPRQITDISNNNPGSQELLQKASSAADLKESSLVRTSLEQVRRSGSISQTNLSDGLCEFKKNWVNQGNFILDLFIKIIDFYSSKSCRICKSKIL